MSKLMALFAGTVVAAAALMPMALSIGTMPGPCSIAVECADGSQVGCAGEIQCTYKYTTVTPGWVQCDSQPTNYCM